MQEIIITTVAGILAIVGFYWAFIEDSKTTHTTK